MESETIVILTGKGFEKTQPEETKNLLLRANSKNTNRKYFLDLLIVWLGIGSWLGINSYFIELPLLIEQLPEGWKLASFMNIATQAANIGPLLYWILRPKDNKTIDSKIIYCLLSLGCLSQFFSVFLYKSTVFIAGEERSVLFFVFIFFTALVGCTGNVLFFPYIRHFKSMYLTTYILGEGLTGFIPSIIGLFQGVDGSINCLQFGENHVKFSVSYFFLIITIILAFAVLSFYLLINSKYCRSELVDTLITTNNKAAENITITKLKYWNLIILNMFISGSVNGILPGLQSYSCLPYGNTALYLSINLSRIANPLVYLFGFFYEATSNAGIGCASVAYFGFLSYIIMTSVSSPFPPMVQTVTGEYIIIGSWVGVCVFSAYVRLNIAKIFRAIGGSAMFQCSAYPQIGSAIMAFIMFILINFTNVFQRTDPCQ